MDALIRGISCTRSRLARPPFGATNDDVLALLGDMGFQVVTWNLDTRDWQHGVPGGDAQQIVQVVSDTIDAEDPNGIIYLQHDTNGPGLAVVGDVIDLARARGYEIVSLERCLYGPSFACPPPLSVVSDDIDTCQYHFPAEAPAGDGSVSASGSGSAGGGSASGIGDGSAAGSADGSSSGSGNGTPSGQEDTCVAGFCVSAVSSIASWLPFLFALSVAATVLCVAACVCSCIRLHRNTSRTAKAKADLMLLKNRRVELQRDAAKAAKNSEMRPAQLLVEVDNRDDGVIEVYTPTVPNTATLPPHERAAREAAGRSRERGGRGKRSGGRRSPSAASAASGDSRASKSSRASSRSRGNGGRRRNGNGNDGDADVMAAPGAIPGQLPGDAGGGAPVGAGMPARGAPVMMPPGGGMPPHMMGQFGVHPSALGAPAPPPGMHMMPGPGPPFAGAHVNGLHIPPGVIPPPGMTPRGMPFGGPFGPAGMPPGVFGGVSHPGEQSPHGGTPKGDGTRKAAW